MDSERIDDIVCEIMFKYGPYGHVDGHEVITAFIVALLKDEGEAWFARHIDSRY